MAYLSNLTPLLLFNVAAGASFVELFIHFAHKRNRIHSDKLSWFMKLLS